VSEDRDKRGEQAKDTRSEAYTARLDELGGAGWKRFFDVQAPYRWNLRRLGLGFTLDVGCGIGRNLINLEGSGVGVDHNATSVAMARQRGCTAYTHDDFLRSEHARQGRFDSLLIAHVVEHMSLAEASTLLGDYLGYVRSGGLVVLIAPQEAGYRSDPSHREFMDFDKLETLLRSQQVEPLRSYSFPFPRWVGRVFPHNEFVSVGRRS
jgi:2-polyprenyl-3-methyl-5-hydroxy-6-metoxy-1,4-benzoquinol methylase